jgi:hypothetical protein
MDTKEFAGFAFNQGIQSSGLGIAMSAKDYAKKLWEILLRMFRLETFQILVMFLVFIAYLLFVFATILFVNATINLHKTIDNKATGTKKLKDLPMFDYLKKNNFMFLDDSMLNKASVLFLVTIGVIVGAIIFLGLHYIVLNNNEGNNQGFKAYCSGLFNPSRTYIIAITLIPYLFYLIVLSLYNTQVVDNTRVLDDDLDVYRKNNPITLYKRDALKDIKKVIQENIYSGSYHSAPVSSKFEKFMATADTDPKNTIDIDITSIFLIYHNNLKNKDGVAGATKQYAREYINYMDEYFDLLGRKGDPDNYQKFYLLGLIEYDDDIPLPEEGIYDLFRGFRNNLINVIRTKITTYFITTITLYATMCIAVICIVLVFNDTARKLFVALIYSLYNKMKQNITGVSVMSILLAIIAGSQSVG